MERQPLGFFLKGAGALMVLFVVTLMMEPRPEVNALRAGILFGLGLIGLKVVLRHYNIDFPPRRHRPLDPPRRSK
jgi:galactitol-specific phosphotransferase system IIC component